MQLPKFGDEVAQNSRGHVLASDCKGTESLSRMADRRKIIACTVGTGEKLLDELRLVEQIFQKIYTDNLFCW
jgi:hypothetical protein